MNEAGADRPILIRLDVQRDGADAEEVDTLTRRLYAELSGLAIEDPEHLPRGATPNGAKVTDPVTLGALAIAVLPSLLPKIMDFLDKWSQRAADSKIKLKIVRSGDSVEIELPAKHGRNREAGLGCGAPDGRKIGRLARSGVNRGSSRTAPCDDRPRRSDLLSPQGARRRRERAGEGAARPGDRRLRDRSGRTQWIVAARARGDRGLPSSPLSGRPARLVLLGTRGPQRSWPAI